MVGAKEIIHRNQLRKIKWKSEQKAPTVPTRLMYMKLFVGTTVLLFTNILKIGLLCVMSEVLKYLSASSSSLINFEMEWHSSQFHKQYKSQGHKFESRECYRKAGMVKGPQFDPYNSVSSSSCFFELFFQKIFSIYNKKQIKL